MWREGEREEQRAAVAEAGPRDIQDCGQTPELLARQPEMPLHEKQHLQLLPGIG